MIREISHNPNQSPCSLREFYFIISGHEISEPCLSHRILTVGFLLGKAWLCTSSSNSWERESSSGLSCQATGPVSQGDGHPASYLARCMGKETLGSHGQALPELSKLLFFLCKMELNNITVFRELISRIKLDHTCETFSTVLGTEWIERKWESSSSLLWWKRHCTRC